MSELDDLRHLAAAVPGVMHPHTACLLSILDVTDDPTVRCMADLQAVLGRVRRLAAEALGETLPEESARSPPAGG